MKKTRRILIAVLILSVMVGYNSIDRKKTVSAATTSVIKADSDFTLKLPNNWKRNYTVKKTKSKKNGSYVAVYPTDVQSLGAGKAAEKRYSKLNKSTEKVAKSIQPR